MSNAAMTNALHNITACHSPHPTSLMTPRMCFGGAVEGAAWTMKKINDLSKIKANKQQ
jgi:hypothetical protein